LVRFECDVRWRNVPASYRGAKSQGVDYVSMIDLFCSSVYCAVAHASGSPLMFDEEHFTMDGSLFAAKRLTDVDLGWSTLAEPNGITAMRYPVDATIGLDLQSRPK